MRPPRVVITRSLHQGAPLVQRLRDHGVGVHHLPLIAQRWLPSAGSDLAAAGPVDAVLLTSPFPAAQLAGTLHRPLWSVGSATTAAWGAAAAEQGAASAADLLDGLRHRPPQRVLFPHGVRLATSTVHAMARSPHRFHRVVVYENTHPVVSPAALDDLLPQDLAPLFSGSAAERLAQALSGRPLPQVVAIGPKTRQVAEELGFSVLATAASPTEDALVDALRPFLP